jgi:hypothetical protein
MNGTETALVAFLIGAAIYVATALLLGRERAAKLPGGAVCAAIFFSPLYISIPMGLLGHIAAVIVANKMRK